MIGDTIFAIASPPGSGARGILRLSGPAARSAVARALGTAPSNERAARETTVSVLGHDVACLVLTMPAPHSYTGEDCVELHLPGSPLLLDEVCATFAPDARLATPGEFTRRAFENGRLDLAEAEAVLQLIGAADVEESRFAVEVLRGGLGAAVDSARGEIQDGLALLEAGLDFERDETGAVDPELYLPTLQRARRRVDDLLLAVPRTATHGDVLLLGAANAGKSSLANSLIGRTQALVAPIAGTTRDVVAFELAPDVRLLDGPGDVLEGASELADLDARAAAHREARAQSCGGAIVVIDLTAPHRPTTSLPVLAEVFTKRDLVSKGPPPPESPSRATGPPQFVVSNATGAGIVALRDFLLRRASGGHHGLSTRLHGSLTEVLEALGRAETGIVAGQPEELTAIDLRTALEGLDRIHGASSAEDLLDRIFAGFCLGK